VKKPVGILRFLGTNCDRDVWQAVETVSLKPRWLWYEDRFKPEDYSGFIVPGGFSHGDYLRCGALAAKAPVMQSLREAGDKGFPILGICNGFQILTESRLLPGALVRNENRKFIDKWVTLRLANTAAFAKDLKRGVALRLPVAHGEGRYYLEGDDLRRIQDRAQVWFTYDENVNGSVESIAGVTNENKNVCGLMPHPERAVFSWMGGEDGRLILNSLLG
jgi:phosphoribosylformylglycinamidine synthase I